MIQRNYPGCSKERKGKENMRGQREEFPDTPNDSSRIIKYKDGEKKIFEEIIAISDTPISNSGNSMNPKEVNKNKHTPRRSEIKILMKKKRYLKYQRIKQNNHKGQTIRLKIHYSAVETEARRQ